MVKIDLGTLPPQSNEIFLGSQNTQVRQSPVSGSLQEDALFQSQRQARINVLNQEIEALQGQLSQPAPGGQGLDVLSQLARNVGFSGGGRQQGGGQKLSATEQKDLALLSQSLSLAKQAGTLINSGTIDDLFGGGKLFGRLPAIIADALGLEGKGTKKRRQADVTFNNLVIDIQRAISGAQLNDKERAFIQATLPRIEDDLDTAKFKIKTAIERLGNTLKSRTQTFQDAGFNVPRFDLQTGTKIEKPGELTVDPRQVGQIEVVTP